MYIEPLCIGCNRWPKQIPEMVAMAAEERTTPERWAMEDGTYNHTNGHFLCDGCYITAGMPSEERGWKAP